MRETQVASYRTLPQIIVGLGLRDSILRKYLNEVRDRMTESLALRRFALDVSDMIRLRIILPFFYIDRHDSIAFYDGFNSRLNFTGGSGRYSGSG